MIEEAEGVRTRCWRFSGKAKGKVAVATRRQSSPIDLGPVPRGFVDFQGSCQTNDFVLPSWLLRLEVGSNNTAQAWTSPRHHSLFLAPRITARISTARYLAVTTPQQWTWTTDRDQAV